MSLKRLQVGNNGRASLSAGISSTALAFSLEENPAAALEDNLDGIPSGTGIAFLLTLEDEIILCAARAGAAVTVYEEDTHALGFLSAGEDGRGYGSTSAASHIADKQAECRSTKQLFDEIMDGIEDAETELALRYTKVEVNALLASKNTKDPVECATTGAQTLASDFENGDTIDGIVLATGNRVLVKDQASADENGIYIVAASGAPTRSTDMDASAEFNAALVPVLAGTSNADTLWLQTTDDPVVETDNIVFSNIAAALIKATDSDAATGTNDTKYMTAAKVVHLLGNLASSVATWFVSHRTAKTTPVDTDLIVLSDSADIFKDKKVTIANLRKILAPAYITGSRVFNAANGAVTYAHGLGKIPTSVDITGEFFLATHNMVFSTGGASATATNCAYSHWNNTVSPNYSTAGVSSAFAIKMYDAVAYGNVTGVITFDDTNVTITWTNNSSTSGSTFHFAMKVNP